jgi:hypothetical protein
MFNKLFICSIFVSIANTSLTRVNTMKSFEEKAQELMQSHPNEVRNMAKNGNKYERAVAEIILESVGEQSNAW